jgi:rhodanese-related sulfurtransferase
MRSQRVALFLQAQGFDTLANITGGVSAWPA